MCGSDPNDAERRPERLDGTFGGSDEDGDGTNDEMLPSGAATFDCDGDGYSGAVEEAVFGVAARGDQDPCGLNGWPSDMTAGGVPNSTNRLTVSDLTAFLAPWRRLETSPGDTHFSSRADLVPGRGLFAKWINVGDLTALLAGSSGSPPMLGGAKAFGGPACPWPP